VFARQQAMTNPDQPAIIMASSGETVTFGEYEARCNQVAHLLRDAGLRRGDHIAVFMENSTRLLEIEGGAERVGLYYTLVNTYLSADEVAYIVANSQAKALISSAARREVAAAAAEQEELEAFIQREVDAGAPLPGTYPPSEELLARYRASRDG